MFSTQMIPFFLYRTHIKPKSVIRLRSDYALMSSRQLKVSAKAELATPRRDGDVCL